ncbi:tetratricopeptide repeat protein [Ahniella affigens]|uniref:tetratricopeptide repeat protein n=1 Tax=Ahniella affigens TaxID=2021234 RepID=UPI0011B28C21|nr:hypothetical protein [Ahniella affigens]
MRNWCGNLAIGLGAIAALAALAACAPQHQSGGGSAGVAADWCFQGVTAPSAARSDGGRYRQGFRWLDQARQTGDPGFLIAAAACADLNEAGGESAPALSADANVNLLRMQVMMSRHEFARAQAYGESWLATGEAPPLAMLLVSDALLELGRVTEATELANQAMRARPDQNAYARVAHLRWLHGEIEGAKAMYLDLLQNRNPVHPEVNAQRFLELAKLVQMQGDQAGARALVQAGLRDLPDHRDSLLWVGRTALAANDAAAAHDALRRLEQGFVDIPVLALKRDLARLEQRDAEMQALNARIDQLGRRGEGFAYALDLLARQTAPERALALIQAERRSRHGLELDAAEANALMQLGRADAALPAIEQALRFGTPEPTWLSLRAEILTRLNRPEDAQLAMANVAAIQVLLSSSDHTIPPTARSP